MTGEELIVKDGRHPVIERNLPVGEAYISNDLELNKTNSRSSSSRALI
jgi:DNA mismatch repair protein MutS